MVGGQVTIVPRNPVTLGDSIGTLANALRTEDIDRQNQQMAASDQQSVAQKRQDEMDQKQAADALSLINSQKTEAGKLAVRNYILKNNPHLSRFLVGSNGMPMDEATQQSDMQTTNAAHVGRDASALVRDQYENPNAAPAPSRALIDAHLPGTTAASPKDQFEAQDRDTVAGGANPLGGPAVPGVSIPSRNPLADTLRGSNNGNTAAPAPTPTPPPPPAAPPAVVRPPMPVSTDGRNTAGTMTGGALHRMFAGDLSVQPPDASRGPGAVPAAASAAAGNADQGSAPASAPAPAPASTTASAPAADYMQGVVPAKQPNPAQMEATRQRQGLDLNAEQQFGAADKVGSLNATVARDKATAAHQQREDTSIGNLRSAQAAEVRQKTADAKNGTGGLLTSGGDGSGGDSSGNAVGVPSLQKSNLSKYDPRAIALVRGAIDPAMLIQLQRKDPALAANLLAQAMQIDPEFSTANYPMYKKTITDYGPSGAVGKQAASVNTAIDHLYNAYEQSKKLGNRSSSWYNFMANIVQAKFDPQLQEALADMGKKGLMAAKEVNKALSGGGQPGEKETEELHQNMGENDGPHAVRGAVGGAAALLAGRIREWNDAQTRQIGRSRPIVNLLSQAAADKLRIMQKEGVNVGDWGQMLDNPNTRTAVADRQPGNTVTDEQPHPGVGGVIKTVIGPDGKLHSQ